MACTCLVRGLKALLSATVIRSMARDTGRFVVSEIVLAPVAEPTTVLSGDAVNVKVCVALVGIGDNSTCLCTLITACFVLRTREWTVYLFDGV